MEKTPLIDKIAFNVLAVFVVILPLFFIPSNSFSFIYAKAGLLMVAVFAALILLLIRLIHKGEITLPWLVPFLVLVSVPFFTLISSFLSHSMASSFMGRGVETDTFYFIGLCFLLAILCAVYFQEKQKALYVYLGFMGAFALVALFAILRFIFGVHFLSLGLFTSIVDNTLGSWSDLGIYAGIAVIMSLITLESLSFERYPRIALYAILVAGLFIVAVTNTYIVYDFLGVYLSLSAIMAIFAALFFLYLASLNYRTKGSAKFKVPVLSLAVLMVSVIVTIWATPIVSTFYSYENISSADVSDVRPTISATTYVASHVAKAGVLPALFGGGPNRFSTMWASYKPIAANQGDTWSTDFDSGAGYVLTSLVTTGILGFLAWICSLLYFFYLVGRALWKGIKDQFSFYLVVSSGAVSLYLWFIEVFYVPGASILVFAFAFTGITLASLVREGRIPLRKFSWTGGHKRATAALAAIVLVIIGMMVVLSIWINDCIASVDASRAVNAVSVKGDSSGAESLLATAITKDPADSYLNLYSQVKLYELQTDLRGSGATTLDATTEPIYGNALTAALQAAQSSDPYNYENWLFLGNVYELGAELGVSQAAQNALAAFVNAEKLAPSSPLPFYLTGQLYSLGHDAADARTQLQEALTLKSNYTDAQTLLDNLSNQPTVDAAEASSSKSISGSIASTTPKTAKSTASTTAKAK